MGRAASLAHADPRAALIAARAAAACATAAGPLVPEPARLADLRGRAWASVANAQRVCGRHPAAERAFSRAAALVAKGTGDPLVEAGLKRRRATLRLDQRRWAEAEDDFGSAAALFVRAGDTAAAVGCELMLAVVLYGKHDLTGAFSQVRAAMVRLDGASAPELYFQALHRQIGYLSELGRPVQALALSESLDYAYSAFGGPVVQVRGTWLRGKIHSDLHEWAVAAAYFERVRHSFLNRGMLYDAALAGLDLALAYSELGRRDDVRKLAEEMYDVFTAQQIPREASAALLLFADSALQRKADSAFIREIGRQLEAMRRAAPSL